MRTFKEIKEDNKDYVYKLNINGKSITLTRPFNSISDTYGCLILTVYDDAFTALKNNMWLLDLSFAEDIPYVLVSKNFYRIE